MRKNVLHVKNIPPLKGISATGRFFTKMNAVAVLLPFLCAAVSAQSPLGLHYPFGMPDLAVTGAAAAMGGSGTAVAEEHLGTSLNPANMAIGGRSAYSATVSLDMVNIRDDGKSSTVSGYAPKLLSLILPIGAAGNIGFAMQTRYNANINYYMTTDITTDIDKTEGKYKANTIDLQNTGGLTSWQAGWGYRFKNGLSFGLIYERLFFNEEASSTFESVFRYKYENGGTDTYKEASLSRTETTSFSSDGIRFGTQIPVHEKVTAGIAAEYVFSNSNGKTSQLDESEFSLSLPPSINIGLAYKPDERWLVAADAQSTLWQLYDNEFDELFGDEEINIPQTFGVSAGGRFVPAANRLSAKYWEKIHYSAGLRYCQLPLKNSHEYALSAGTGLPIPNGGGLIDIVFELGQRIDRRYSKYSENTVKFMLGINGGRNWFQKDTRNY